MTLYFTDIRNNLDSLVIGYDPYGSHYHNSFEGPLLDEPFDSILDVRGTTGYDYRDFGTTFDLTKKVIVEKKPPPPILPNGCFTTNSDFIVFVQIMYPPVTVTWDKGIIGSMPCLWGSYFSWDESSVIQPPWWVVTQNFTCMKNQDTLVHTLGEEEWGEYSAVFEINNGTMDTVYAFRVLLNPPFPGLEPCPNPGIVDVDELLKSEMSFEVHPNPGSDRLHITFPQENIQLDEVAIQIQSLAGQRYEMQSIYQNSGKIALDTSELSAGIYIVIMRDVKTKQVLGVRKWVKY